MQADSEPSQVGPAERPPVAGWSVSEANQTGTTFCAPSQAQHQPRQHQPQPRQHQPQPCQPAGSPPDLQGSALVLAKRTAKHQKKWNRRLRIFFCCLGHKKNKDSIADVASIFAEFYSDLNAPSSDIAAGFVLLSKYQEAQRQWILRNPGRHQPAIDQYLSNIPIREDTKFLDIQTADDSHLINDLIYYMNYSLAIFGWPLQVIDDPCMLCCIYPYLRLSPCCSSGKKRTRRKKERAEGLDGAKPKPPPVKSSKSKRAGDKKSARADAPCVRGAPHAAGSDENNNHDNSNKCNGAAPAGRPARVAGKLDDDCDMPVILEDNCCGCNSASAERRLAQHNYEIIYISYKCNVNVVPFLVATDHSKQSVVVAIRGSMSLSDMVTDMNGTVDKVPVENCPDDWLCHRGITRAAMYVKQTLLEERILERAFACRPDLGSNTYTLVLCGHSLGAGAAGILGVLMRPLYPTLKAYLYSPPGGILSLPVVEYTKEFATGIILGNDTVPRLGVAQLERLRYHTLLSLKSAQKSPSRILARALCPTMCVGRNKVDYDPEQSLDLLHGTDGSAFDYNDTKIPFQVQPQVLYVPGRLIHVLKDYSFRSRTQRFWSGPIYQAVWTDNLDYDRIMISEGMFFDHLPNNLMHAMKMLFSRTLPARRESHTTPAAPTMAHHHHHQVSPSKSMQFPPATEATVACATNANSQMTVYNINVRASELYQSFGDDHNNNIEAKLKNVIEKEMDNSDGNNNDNNNNDNNTINEDENNNTEIVISVRSL